MPGQSDKTTLLSQSGSQKQLGCGGPGGEHFNLYRFSMRVVVGVYGHTLEERFPWAARPSTIPAAYMLWHFSVSGAEAKAQACRYCPAAPAYGVFRISDILIKWGSPFSAPQRILATEFDCQGACLV
jgi:hypothetical protein